MANKFQRSVQERLEQEAARQKKQDQPSQSLETVTTKTPIEQTMEAPKAKKEPQPKKVAAQTASALPDITLYIQKEPQRLAKNKTFYLDTDVIDAIKKVAKQQGITDSKLVNDVLRKVLALN